MLCVERSHRHFLANLDCFKVCLALVQFNPSQKNLVSKKMPQTRANLGLIWVFIKVKNTKNWKQTEQTALPWVSGPHPAGLSICWEQEGGGRRGAITYGLVCGGRCGQLRGLPSYWVGEVVVGSDLRIKLVLGKSLMQLFTILIEII